MGEKLEKQALIARYAFLGEDVINRIDGLFLDISVARTHLDALDKEIESQGGTFKTINGRKKFNPLIVERERLAAHANYLLDRLERIARGTTLEEDDGLGEFE